MIVVFTEKSTNRLQYVCQFIFEEQLGLSFQIVENVNDIPTQTSIIINYSDQEISNTTVNVKPHGLLHETGIRAQNPVVRKLTDDYFVFFETDNESSYRFDIFSAIFYLISRYEEYLPHTKDMYGRYAHENALAFQNGFLNIPLVNIWINQFADFLKSKRSTPVIKERTFKTLFSYDIDMAWSYKHKGFWRNLAGFCKKPDMKRWKVLLGMEPDPFDTFEKMDLLHLQNKTECIYFFLIARRLSRYDKNIRLFKKSMRSLIQQHALKYRVGIHPSWRSNQNDHVLQKEIRRLSSLINKSVTESRQHYVKWEIPNSFRQLIENGITDDYSMGYGSINGFRASVTSPFFWYDLPREEVTPLRLHPFCFMDANCHFEQKLTIEEASKEYQYYFNISKNHGTAFIPIFHNHFLGSEPEFAGWGELWKEMVINTQSV